jgi:geranylgeranyl transferase type-2 subunit beta
MATVWCSVLLFAAVAAGGEPARAKPPPPPAFPFDEPAARQYQEAHAAWAALPVKIKGDLGMTFALVPPGTFVMGSPENEVGHNAGGFDETQHKVTLTRPFYLSVHETTVGQFRRFVEDEKYITDGERNGGGHAHDGRADWRHREGTSWRKPGYAGTFELRDEMPVVHMSHADSRAFCRWLTRRWLAQPAPMQAGPIQSPPAQRASSQQRALPGLPAACGDWTFTLPTEAQWEWACRAGAATRYTWGNEEDTSGKVINAGDRALKRMHPEWPRTIMPMDDGHAFCAPVGSFRANAFGLYDMLGNVWEFCSTHYGPYPRAAVTDPAGGDPKRGFAVRGGGWSNVATDVRCATRNADPPHFCHSNLGFRVALVPPESLVISQEEVFDGLREFYRKTAREDGSFQPGVDPDYLGMSDCAYSDLAAATYAVTIHRTLGWNLPHEQKTVEFLLSRQKENGDFFNVAGTVDPASAEGRVYNTTQGLVALRALGVKPRFDPLGVFEEILRADYKTLPAYSTSFFPLAYRCYGKPIPPQADRKIRATMVQAADGYLNDHIAATFHAAHYYRLVGEPTPKAQEMLYRIVRDQKPDGSWLLNMPSRDRHATFDAVFTLRQLGGGREDCRKAIERAGRWALSCRNADGGFGHFPGSTSDADAVYFHVGTLVMAGFLKRADPLPKEPELLSWGHLMPVPDDRSSANRNRRAP